MRAEERREGEVNTKEEKAGRGGNRDYMEMICDEERCSLRHGACFSCFLIVRVFIIQIYAFNNSLMGHIKRKCVRYFRFKRKKKKSMLEIFQLFDQMLHQCE